MKDGGEWALASMGDVGKWVGDRAKDLDYWWNGTPYNELDPSTVGFKPGDPNSNPRVGGAWRDITSAIGSAGSTIGDAANSVGQWVGNAANDVGTAVDEAWNGKQRTIRRPGPNGNTIIENVREGGIRPGIENAVNAAGKWIGDQANAVGQGVSNFVNGVRPGEAQPYYDVKSGKWVYPTMPSLGERIQGGLNAAGQWIGDTANNAWNGVTGAANDVGQWVGNTANNAGQAIQNGWNTLTGQNQNNQGTPFTQAASQQAQNIGNAIFGEQAQENPVLRFFNTSVLDPNLGANATDAWNQVTGQRPQQGNWFNDNIVTPVANGWNGVTNFVRDTANNAAQGASNLWNGTDQSFLGIPTGHTPGLRENIGNAISNAGQTVANGAQNLWNGATSALSNAGQGVKDAVNGAASAASNTFNDLTGNINQARTAYLQAGGDPAYVDILDQQLGAGNITPAEYNQRMRGNLEVLQNTNR